MIIHPALVLAVAAPAAGSDLLSVIGFPVLMVVAFYFLLILPQQRRQRAHQTKVQGIKRGDTVVLSSGMIGKVVRVEENEIGLEIAQNVTVKVVKGMVSEVRTRGEPAAANDAKK